MDCISNFESTKEDHIHEEKVLHFTDYDTSQLESSTQKSEQSVANEPTSSKVVKEDLLGLSMVLDEGNEGLDDYLANEITCKGVSTRILDDEPFEYINQSLPLTTLQAFKFQGRAKNFFGPRSSQKKDEVLVKTGQVKIPSLYTRGKDSIEAERNGNLMLFRSELGIKDRESKRKAIYIYLHRRPLEAKRKTAEQKRRKKPHIKT